MPLFSRITSTAKELLSPHFFSLCLVAASLTPAITNANFTLGLSGDTVSGDYEGATYRSDLWLELGAFHHEDKGEKYHLGFLLTDPNFSFSGANRGYDDRSYDNSGYNEFPQNPYRNDRAGLGMRLIYVDTLGGGGTAIAVGGHIGKSLSGTRFNANLSAYYAPSVTTFSDLDTYYNVTAKLGYDLIDSATFFVAYRKIHAALIGLRDVNQDEGVHVGVEFRFNR